MANEKIYNYTVVFEPLEEGGYMAFVPLLSGCITEGETYEETKKNVKEAISLYVSVLREDGEEIPVEKDSQTFETVSVAVAF